MSATSIFRPIAPDRLRISPAWLSAATVLVVAVLLRAGMTGNLLAGLDEQFYLLVGDRMWQGDLPYVDIWDRKPVGLFVLFAAMRLLPGDGIVATQGVATLFAAGTAYCVALIARRQTGWIPSTLAAILYLASLNELGGETTQTPVFYNLFIAVAALLCLRAAEDMVQYRRMAVAAILLACMSIQIKTNALFQCAAFMLWLIVCTWRQTGDARLTARTAVVLIVVAAMPTIAAAVFYASIGRFSFWWQANILSILSKKLASGAEMEANLWQTVILFTPLGLLALLGLWARTKRFTQWHDETIFIVGWCVVSLVDFVSLGGFCTHYALPLVLASSTLAASIFALQPIGAILFGVSMLWPIFHAGYLTPRLKASDNAIALRVIDHVPSSVRTDCMFIYEGPVGYYGLTHACLPTRFPFSAHLSSRREGPSLGIDPATELDAIMRRKPAAIMTVEHYEWPDRDIQMERRLMAHLRTDYRLTARLPHRYYSKREKLLIWQRR